MDYISKFNLNSVSKLMLVLLIFSVNLITLSTDIPDNLSNNPSKTYLCDFEQKTKPKNEMESILKTETYLKTPDKDSERICSTKTNPLLSNGKLETVLEDGSIITSLETVYEQAGISIIDQDPNKFVRVTDSKVLVTIGLNSHYKLNSSSFNIHLLNTKSEIKHKLSELNAVVLNVPISSLKAFLLYWQALESIRYVELAQVTSVSAVSNDPDWDLQYGTQIIQTDLAWDFQIGDPESILVAVIDTGVDYNHPDLVNQYISGGYDFVNDDADPMDDHSHGTHCAGVIGATINNSVGISGIANVSIMAQKVFDSGGYGYDYDAATAIINATDAGATVLSNSYGFPSSSTALEDAVDYAAANDVVIVVSAGNSAAPVSSYPALYPETIVVSATDDADIPASFTSYGSSVDVAAPGVDIWSTIPVSMGSYGYMSGTSMACPHVAAVCALIRAEFPIFSADQVRQHLRTSADDLGEIGWDDYYGYGRINAFHSVQPPPEHDLITYLYGTPMAMLPNDIADLEVVVYNYGQYSENNIEIQLWIEDNLVKNEIFESLAVGENCTIEYSWTETEIGEYNITAYVVSVSGETYFNNNKVTKIVDVTLPIIDYNLDDYIQLNQADGTLFANFTYTYDIDEKHAQVDFGDGANWFLINTLTRMIEDGSLWVGMYYLGQIETNIDIGDNIKWYSTTGIVLETVYYDWNGMILEAWNISISWEDTYAYYHKETGIWLYYHEGSGLELFMIDTNMIPIEHDIETYLETPLLLAPSESITLNASVYNGGENNETNVELQLWINDEMVTNQIYSSLAVDAIETLSYYWSPIVKGVYNVTAYAIPVNDEIILANNIDTKMVDVTVLTFISDFEEILSGWTWDGLWHIVNDSQIYGNAYSPIHSMYYGDDSTGDYDTGNSNSGSLITPWFILGPDVIALNFWSWYETEESGHSYDIKDIYLITSEELWVHLGYVNGSMNSWSQFSFDISSYTGQTVRFAFVFDTVDSIANSYQGWYIDDIIILGSATKIKVHDIVITFNVPSIILFGNNVTLNASVTNLGDFDEPDVEIQLWINDNLVENKTLTLLLIGGVGNLNYYWTPTELGYYNITANVLPVPDETFIIDNKQEKMVNVKEPGEYLILQDANPWGYDWLNILDSNGITYDVIGSANFGSVDLSMYQKVIIPSDQPQSFYENIDNHSLWLENYTINGGIVEIHAADGGWNSGYWVGSLPSGINYVHYENNIVDIADPEHDILNSPYIISDNELDGWDSSVHGYLTNIGYSNVILTSSGDPVLIETAYGLGFFIISTQTLEYGYSNSYSLILENFLLFTPIIYEHDLEVFLEAPMFVKYSTFTILNVSVTNRGLSDEIEVEVELWINDSIVESVTFPLLLVSNTESFSYYWTPIELGYYNITVHAIPVTDESVIIDNVKNCFILVDNPIIDFDIGNYIHFNQTDSNGTLLPPFHFIYLYFIDSNHIYAEMIYDFTSIWFSVNIITRVIEDSNTPEWIGGFWLAQIETNIGIGDSVFWLNSVGTIVDEVKYEHGDIRLDAWNVSIPTQNCWLLFHKTTGVWLYYSDLDGYEMYMTVTDMIYLGSIIGSDTIKPVISLPPDITYEEGSNGNLIQWITRDTNPGSYIIYKNNIIIEEDYWGNNVPIEINIDGLNVGTYNYTIIVSDLFDNSVVDTVFVTIIPKSDVTTTTITSDSHAPGFDFMLSLITLIALGVIFLNIRKGF